MATMDAVKVREAIGSFKGTLGILPGSESMESSNKFGIPQDAVAKRDSVNTARESMETPVSEINEITQSANKEVVTLEESEDGFLVRLPSELFFSEGSAQIEYEDGYLFIKRMAMVINRLPNDIEVSVRGHTDNAMVPNSVYKDNWELSTARAITVVREFIKDGVNAKKLHAAGFADNVPLASNITPEGRTKNRRVDLYFFSKKKDNERAAKKSILDMQK
jgi:chemotaxis protein MotB